MSDELKKLISSLKNSKLEEDRKRCIPLLQNFLDRNPQDAESWYDLAGCFDFTGQEALAEPCYRKVYELGIDLIPETERAGFFVGFGSTLRNNLQLAESHKVLKTGTEIFHHHAYMNAFFAFTLYSEGHYKQAAEQLFQAISKVDGRPFEGYEKAIKWYTANLGTHPRRPLPQKVETERLILRPVVDSDVDAIFEYGSVPRVSEFTTWLPHQTREDSQKLVEYAKANYQKGLCEPLAITLKENSDKLIGTVGWFWNSEKYKSIELAYALSPAYWGQGIVLEACKALVSQALQTHDILRITSRCISGNTSSARVMEKLGMEYEGTQKRLMQVKGHFVDIKNYCVLSKDWKFS